MTEPFQESGSHAGPPRWVANVLSPRRSGVGFAVVLATRGYRLAVIAAVALLGPALIWAWRLPLTTSTVILRGALALFAAAAIPVLIFRWINPRTAGRPLRLEQISPAMLLAVIVSEDPYFFWHVGFNPIEIARAWRYNRRDRPKNGLRRGGSSITQQLAKNLFLWTGQSWLRKGLEAVLAGLLDALWPKRRILEVYLNIVPFGNGWQGIAAAAEGYFNQPAARLDDAQAAALTLALRGPHVHPVLAPTAKTLQLREQVRQRMRWCGPALLGPLGSHWAGKAD